MINGTYVTLLPTDVDERAAWTETEERNVEQKTIV